MEKIKITAPEEYPKTWGKELWIANSSKYCGKKLIIEKGKKCSAIHYHKKGTKHSISKAENFRWTYMKTAKKQP